MIHNSIKKQRIDILLVERELVDTRSKAQAMVMAGNVFADGKRVDKSGMNLDVESEIVVKNPFPYVSRGSSKIEKAFDEFKLDFTDKIVCDIGSSTGGFTDFVLQHGAKRVYAVDVGRGQLAQKLREDPRVVVMEETDFRDLDGFSEKIDYFVCDVSFVSLRKIIPKIATLSAKHFSESILLVKPQFEAGRKEASRGKGVIKDEKLRKQILEDIKLFSTSCGFEILGFAESPLKGAKGNVEFLLWLKNPE